MTTPTTRRRDRATALLLTLFLVAIVVSFQWSIARSIGDTATRSWQTQAPAAGVHVVALGVPRIGWKPWATAWLPVDDAGVVSAPVLAIGPGCGLAEELTWPNEGFQHGPQHVRWVWLVCWR